jgi:putative ABC transport system substrate-binding protein
MQRGSVGRMDRRQVIASGFAAALLARGAYAAPRSGARVGYLEFVSAPDGEMLYRDFVEGLKKHGYAEGRNLTIVRRSAGNANERLPAMAAELAAARVEVILAASSDAARGAKSGAPKTPTVFVMGGNPVLEGLVTSLSRPGGQLTGIVTQGEDLTAKRLQLLKEAFPAIRTVAVVGSPLALSRSAYDDAAQRLQLSVVALRLVDHSDFRDVAATIGRGAADAVLVVDDADAVAGVYSYAKVLMATRRPVMFNSDVFVEAHGLMAYGASLRQQYRRAAGIVAQLLEGAKAAQVPVQMPAGYELWFNRRAGEEFSIELPREVQTRGQEINSRTLD